MISIKKKEEKKKKGIVSKTYYLYIYIHISLIKKKTTVILKIKFNVSHLLNDMFPNTFTVLVSTYGNIFFFFTTFFLLLFKRKKKKKIFFL